MCAAFAGRLVVSKQHRSVCEGEGHAVGGRPIVYNSWSDLSMSKAMTAVESGNILVVF